MAVGAKQSDVFEPVVIADAVDVIELQRQRPTKPLSDAASRARVRQNGLMDKSAL